MPGPWLFGLASLQNAARCPSAQSRGIESPAILDLLMAPRIHITSAIAYSNGPPHIGHAYEMLATDAFARFQRRKLGPANVTFVTGTDEHGDKNKRAAEALRTRGQSIR